MEHHPTREELLEENRDLRERIRELTAGLAGPPGAVEEALGEGEALYRQVFDATSDALFVIDEATGLVLDVNRTTLETYGCERDEVVGRDVSHLVSPSHPTTLDKTVERMQRVDTEGPQVFEWLARRSSGEEFPVEVVLTRTTGRGRGRVLASVCDITARRRSEEALAYRQEFERLVSEISTRFINLPAPEIDTRLEEAIEQISCFIGADGGQVFLFSEGGAASLTHGWYGPRLRPRREQMQGVPMEAMALWAEQFAAGRPVAIPDLDALPAQAGPVVAMIAPTGIRSFIDVPLFYGEQLVGFFGTVSADRGREWTDDEQALLMLIGEVFTNALQRKSADQALREREAFLDQAQMLTGIGNFSVDLLGECAVWSDQMYRIHGMEPRLDALEPSLVDLLLEGEWERLSPLFVDESQRTDQAHEAEYRIRRPDGEVRLIRTKAQWDRDGTLLTGTVQDITEQRRAEEERLALEARLNHQQKLESIGTLASGVAHEINNPLNGIMNYAQLIANRLEEGDQRRDFARKIVRESERVSEIVRNLLAFARQEQQTRSPARPVDLVRATLSLIRTVLRKDQIELRVEVAEDLPVIDCRSQRIQQVLMNLLTNARDALNERYPGYDDDKVVTVSAGLVDRDERRWVRFTVADRGPGIAEAVTGRVFDPFYTTKPRDRGTGLGLSVSYGIAHDHGGDLFVETEPGVGTSFHLELPVSQATTGQIGGGPR